MTAGAALFMALVIAVPWIVGPWIQGPWIQGPWIQAAWVSGALAEEPVILTVAGPESAGAPARHFSRSDLEGMEQREIRTTTLWTEGVVTFRGVPLAAVLRAAGGGSGRIRAVALNDYAVEMSVDEVLALHPILAIRQDGAPIPVRQRGPLWLIFDFDRKPEARSDDVLARSVWQLRRLEWLD